MKIVQLGLTSLTCLACADVLQLNLLEK